MNSPEGPAELHDPGRPAEVNSPEGPAEVNDPRGPAEVNNPGGPAEVHDLRGPAGVNSRSDRCRSAVTSAKFALFIAPPLAEKRDVAFLTASLLALSVAAADPEAPTSQTSGSDRKAPAETPPPPAETESPPTEAAPWEKAQASIRWGRIEQAEAVLGDLPPAWRRTVVALKALQARAELDPSAEKTRALPPADALVPRIDLSIFDGCVPTRDHPARQAAQDAIARFTPDPSAALQRLRQESLLGETWDLLRRRLKEAGADPRPAARSLLLETPDTPEASALADALGLAGIARLLPTWSQRISRALTLLDTHQNRRARAEARAWLGAEGRGPGPRGRCRLAYVAGKASRKLRDYTSAMVGLRKARSACKAAGDRTTQAKAILLQAHVAKIRGRADQLAKLADALDAAVGPKHRYWDDIVYRRALVLEDRDLTEARKVLETLVRTTPKGDYRWQAEWKLAWGALMEGDRDRALRHLEPMTRARDRTVRERAMYWQAKLTEKTEPEEAIRVYRELISRVSYHGLLALQRWRALSADEAQSFEAKLLRTAREGAKEWTESPRVDEHPKARLAERLKAAGLWEHARSVLRTLGCEKKWAAPDRLTLARRMEQLGDYAHAQRLVRSVQERLLKDGLTPESLVAWRTAYSRPYWTEIRAAADERELDPLLLLALAREESTFDADVVSWAGAVGLTQLMPPTAAEAFASVEGGRLRNLERLKDPALNARLGAYVLKEGFDRFGSAPLALSNYNAGGRLTRRFVAKGAGPLDRFVESIGVRQTRRYVKKVLGAWARYRALYGSGLLPDLPTRVAGP